MTSRTIASVIATLGLFGTASVLVSAPAAAAPAPARGSHCVVNLDTREMSCADDQAAAQRAGGISIQSVTAVVLYDGTNYDGATFTISTAKACTSSYNDEYGIAYLSDYGWSNRASSVKTYNSCDVRLYDGSAYSGSASTWIDASANLGSIGSGWSNRANSVKIS